MKIFWKSNETWELATGCITPNDWHLTDHADEVLKSVADGIGLFSFSSDAKTIKQNKIKEIKANVFVSIQTDRLIRMVTTFQHSSRVAGASVIKPSNGQRDWWVDWRRETTELKTTAALNVRRILLTDFEMLSTCSFHFVLYCNGASSLSLLGHNAASELSIIQLKNKHDRFNWHKKACKQHNSIVFFNSLASLCAVFFSGTK